MTPYCLVCIGMLRRVAAMDVVVFASPANGRAANEDLPDEEVFKA
jgi:hypothetical protein